MELGHIEQILTSNKIEKFIDIKFAPIFKSIYGAEGISSEIDGHDQLRKISVIWRRSSEIFGKDGFTVFGENI